MKIALSASTAAAKTPVRSKIFESGIGTSIGVPPRSAWRAECGRLKDGKSHLETTGLVQLLLITDIYLLTASNSKPTVDTA
ncbi:MAG: hypothetical protein ACREYC_12625 [Gammaproteobacteria bacterium]